MLDVDNAIPFLLEHHLVERDWIIAGELTLLSAARRNRNLRVEGPGGIGFLIKQPDELSPGSRLTLAQEAAFYEFCQEEAAASALARFMPRLVLRDRDLALHVLELIPNASTLATYHLDKSLNEFPVAASHNLGQALGTLHRTFRLPGLASDQRLNWLAPSIPWAFSVHRKPSPAMLADLSPAGAQAFKIIQSEPSLARRLTTWVACGGPKR